MYIIMYIHIYYILFIPLRKTKVIDVKTGLHRAKIKNFAIYSHRYSWQNSYL